MRDTFDNLSCEEVFELNAVCDEWQQEAIQAQEAELAEREEASSRSRARWRASISRARGLGAPARAGWVVRR